MCRCLEPAEEVFHGAAAGMSFTPGADGSAQQERHELTAARQALRGCVEHVLGPAEAEWDLHMFVSPLQTFPCYSCLMPAAHLATCLDLQADVRNATDTDVAKVISRLASEIKAEAVVLHNRLLVEQCQHLTTQPVVYVP